MGGGVNFGSYSSYSYDVSSIFRIFGIGAKETSSATTSATIDYFTLSSTIASNCNSTRPGTKRPQTTTPPYQYPMALALVSMLKNGTASTRTRTMT